MARVQTEPSAARAAITEVGLWYHTIEVAPGVATPGWFDLRPIVERMPWPDVRGMRCLDVGTWDGFLAFELERRGAAEVVALDIGSHEDWDWPLAMRERGPSVLEQVAGREPGAGFALARELLGSAVERVTGSVYDLTPDTAGEFDVVVCGSLLLHLRDPLRALERIRSVCRGTFLSAEEIDLSLTARHPGRAVLRLDGVSDLFQWFVPNAPAHGRLLEAAGFQIERSVRPYAIPFGEGHPPRERGPRAAARRVARRALAGRDGVPTHAALARA